MENKLDVLTKKLYDEGVEKANREADEIITKAREEAEKIIAEAGAKADEMQRQTAEAIENRKKKAESEMALSARQAVTALKQQITGLISGKVASEIARAGFQDKAFVEELLMEMVKKWDVAGGNLNLEVILPEKEKKQFEAFVTAKCKKLLDQGLEIKAGNLKDAFILQPADGGYQIVFSEALFEAFFNQYIRNFTKSLLYD